MIENDSQFKSSNDFIICDYLGIRHNFAWPLEQFCNLLKVDRRSWDFDLWQNKCSPNLYMSGIINSGNFVSEIPRIFRSFFHHNVFNNMVHIREHSQTFYSDEIDSERAHLIFQYCMYCDFWISIRKKRRKIFSIIKEDLIIWHRQPQNF